MAVNTVRVQINGVWTTLTKNTTTGKYEATVAAPSTTSYNVNANHYYPVIVEATDQAGNVTTVNDAHATLGTNLKLNVKETTKPTVSYNSPGHGAYVGTNTPQIIFDVKDEANGSGIKISSLDLIVNSVAFTNTSPGVAVAAITNGYRVTYTPQAALKDGLQLATVKIKDNDDNLSNSYVINFNVDTVPPVLSLSSPLAETTYRNVASFNAVGVTNDVTSSSVVLTIKHNTAAAETVTVDAEGNFSKTLTLANGTNTIIVTSTDLAGKVSTMTRTIILDTVAPVISAVTITPNPVTTGASYVISLDVTD